MDAATRMIHGKPVNPLLIVGSLALALVLMLVSLPDWAAVARPAFYPVTVLFWALAQPSRFGVFAAWVCGLLLDVIYGTPLGQHALALAVCAFGAHKLANLFRNFPPIQQGLAMVLPLMLIYAFILFWIDGVNGRSVEPLWRWLPALTTAAIWPLWSALMERATGAEVS